MKTDILQHSTGEENLIQLLRKGSERHPKQRNEVFTSDAELIEISEDMNLACTVDSLREEIELGILENPALIGWTSVAISLSDLAAVAADPLGLLLAWTIPQQASDDFLAAVARGAHDAAKYHRTYILGGDCNRGPSLQITTTALGIVPRKSAIQRIGMKPSHSLYLTGRIGMGNGLGFAKLRKLPEAAELEQSYRPKARFDWREMLREFASCVIDTSDGIFASLDILARLNHCGIEFWNRPSFYAEPVRALSSRYGIPLWLFAAAEHGEFELLLSVSPEFEMSFLERCTSKGLKCFRIGTAIRDSQFRIVSSGSLVEIDIRKVRDLAEQLMQDPSGYVDSLIRYSTTMGIQEEAPL